MKKKLLAVALSAVLAVSMLAGCGDKGGTATSGSASTKSDTKTETSTANGGETYEYDIKIWVPEKDVEKGLTASMIEEFNNTNGQGIKFNATIEAVSEADAATQMITDVEAGADMYNFAQDQLSRLIMAGALSKLDETSAKFVRDNNDDGAIAAVAAGDELYGYPITSDNGYYIFYDKSVVSDEQAKTVEGIIEACQASGRTFAAPISGNGWYIAGWFFGTGCDSTWVTDDAGNFISINDTFNSDKGLIAAKGLYKIMSSGVWVEADSADAFTAAIPAAVLVSGPWNNVTIHDMLGDNMGAAKMPTYSVDGKSYQIGSFGGSKIIGVKPQTDGDKAACLAILAEYLSGEDCQKKRFDALEWGPSNKALQATDAVQSNVGLAALAAQAPFAKPQGNIHGSWWDISKAIGAAIKESNGTEQELKDILQKYYDDCNAVFNMTSDEKEAFSVIGGICGTSWDTDFAMTRTAEAGDPTFYSELLELHAGETFKCRQGGSWDVNFGDPNSGDKDGNAIVPADGFYFVKLVTNADYSQGTVTLEKTSYHAYSVIGGICGTAWDTDFEMSVQDDGTTYKLEGVELHKDETFKVRQGHNWDNNWGDPNSGDKDGNAVVPEDGTYTIVFDSVAGAITLEK
ncbi:MAG: extracellular solute-binding protein [Lachnospiraceae bacterium]|nr:extracellular solute-binding protein [Lachnospiraceae bacterium]